VALRGEPDRPVELSLSGFLTTRFTDWLGRQGTGWFAHLSYLRPHPPYAAAGEFATMYDPSDVDLPIAPVAKDQRHGLHEIALAIAASAAPTDPDEMRAMRAQYYGMISEVDYQLGRVVDAIERRGEWDDTLVVITSDHGEQLGDHGLVEKLGFFPQSYHVIGLWRDPRSPNAGRTVDKFSENVDLLPTLADALSLEVPVQCDGRSLAPLFVDDAVEWRDQAHYEWDYRTYFIGASTARWPRDRTLSRQNLAVSLDDELAYVQFADGSYKCFDLVEDPTWRTECRDAERVMRAAQEQLVWRQEHLRRELTDMLLLPSRPGRWPEKFVATPVGATAL
jgi:arylsulfatase A-like enzyme